MKMSQPSTTIVRSCGRFWAVDPFVGVLAVLTVGGLALRAIGLNSQLWYDEIVTLVQSVRLPFAKLISTYPWDNQHTLYSLLAKLCVSVFGESPWALRLMAMLMGTATIPVLYLFGRQVATRREALGSAALLAVSYHHVFYSQNARAYTGLLLATIVATSIFLRSIQAPSRSLAMAYAVVVGLGSYLHLTMVFVALSHAIILIGIAAQGFSPSRRLSTVWWPAAGIVLSGLVSLALHAPMLHEMLAFFTRERHDVASEWKSLSWSIGELVRGLRFGYGLVAVLSALVLCAVGAWRFYRESPVTIALLALPGLLNVGVFALLGRHIWPRLLFFVAGFVLLIVVHGASAFAEFVARLAPPLRRVRVNDLLFATGIAGMVFASLLSLPQNYRVDKQDYLGAQRYIESVRRPTEAVAVAGLAQVPYLEYYRLPWTKLERRAELDAMLSQNPRTWLVYTLPVDLRSQRPELAQAIDREFEVVRVFPAAISGGEIYVLYARSARASTAARSRSIH